MFIGIQMTKTGITCPQEGTVSHRWSAPIYSLRVRSLLADATWCQVLIFGINFEVRLLTAEPRPLPLTQQGGRYEALS